MVDDIQWPVHDGSLHITHNQHLSYYETVEQAILSNTYDPDDFADESEKALCIATGQVWEIQWYPHSPVGFRKVIASTLGRALEAANR